MKPQRSLAFASALAEMPLWARQLAGARRYANEDWDKRVTGTLLRRRRPTSKAGPEAGDDLIFWKLLQLLLWAAVYGAFVTASDKQTPRCSIFYFALSLYVAANILALVIAVNASN
jgi:hypothetical protein